MAQTAAQANQMSAAQEFPLMSWMLNIPELRNLLNDTTFSSEDPNAQQEFMAALENTNWWKTTSPSMRTYAELAAEDPAGLQQQQQQKEADVWDAYLKAGLTPDVPTVQSLATQALQQGWTSAQLNDAITSHAVYSPQMMQQVGNIQTAAQQLQQTAAQNYVTLDDQTAFNWGKAIQAGEHTLQDFQAQVTDMAKNKFGYSPGITNALNSGLTVQQYFQPYQAEAAKLLEVSPDSIDFFNSPQWNKVTDYTDPTTGARREMTIPEMSTYVKSMDQWKSTKNAQQSASQMAEGIIQMFGKVAGGQTGFGAGQ